MTRCANKGNCDVRSKAIILCSASLLAVHGRAQGQSAAGDAPLPAAQAEPGVESDEIVVTGLRRSLQSAQTIKRDSAQIVDTVVAQDIGKLPDVTVSDTAARIVGVQVERGGGEASRVLVRGLPDFTTTYNGREIFTADARAVALQDFPAGAIAALDVYKATTADLVEGGLAGVVNVRSRKPFDFDGFEVAGAAWGQYKTRAGKFDANGNLLVTDRWKTGLGEIGALVNVSFTRLRYQDPVRSNTDFIASQPIGAGGRTVLFPDVQRIGYGEGDRRRPSVNGALQWRPAKGLELYAEGLWQGFRSKVSDRELTVPLYGASAYRDIVLQPGTNVAQSLTAVDPNRPELVQGATANRTDTYQFAVGGTYDAGPLKITADFARTTSKFRSSIYSLDMAYAAPQTVSAIFDADRGQGGPQFAFAGNPDTTSVDTYIYRGLFDRRIASEGKDKQGRIDLSYETGSPLLTQLEVGVRYVDRDASFEDGSRYQSREADRIGLNALPLSYHVFDGGFPTGDASLVRRWLTPTYASLRSNIGALRALSGFAAGDPPADPLITYAANEKSYAGYGQLRYAFGAEAGIHVDGVLGLRVVKTRFSIDGTQSVGGVQGPVDAAKDYTDWLPNVSARIHLTDMLQLRLSATRTRTRPGFSQYNPGQAVDPPVTCGVQNTTTCVRNARGGNPDLEPLKSRNYDASLEYYYSRTGSASVAVFRRDLDGFIQNYQQFVTDPQFGLVRVDRPYNSGNGRIDGAEAQITGFLDFDALPDWARGFGAQANVTYLDAKTGTPAVLGGALTQAPIIGVSKWTYNLNGIYERNGLSLRLTYNVRGAFPSLFRQDAGFPDLTAPGNRLYTEKTKAISRLDLSASYELLKDLTLTFDAANILAAPLRIAETTRFATGEAVTLPRLVRYEESIYSAGLRFRF
jgi:TonB-dependent receptor